MNGDMPLNKETKLNQILEQLGKNTENGKSTTEKTILKEKGVYYVLKEKGVYYVLKEKGVYYVLNYTIN